MKQAAEQTTGNLSSRGFRFVFTAAGLYRWVHPLEMPAGAVDCSDMDDEQFESFAVAHPEQVTQ